ncbi:cobalt transport protein CbiM [Bifidobacterium sp. DSM 109958]|uniref:Cobalt transport protein CbiM n=1 Tax=Bifidobacterium moraviense TaxID=2675323 RepID=A0A7Y0HZR1_9BIFI|nr:cobalt transporter CbiM [Bifidobacterium sp. DSM 109958]NMN01074.1 cobalt transport protein CbiM [Bifidobacterium sp. DSM 109958]
MLDGPQITLAMHIPDNFVSPSTGGLFWLVMIPVWTLCLRAVMREATPEKMAYLGAGAAFSFLVMMFNVPTPGGTTAHGVGGALIAMLLGPQYATIAVSVALLLQALLFGDGGLITLGVNCFNMGVVLPFAAYGVAVLLRGLPARGVPGGARDDAAGGWRERAAQFAGGYVGLTLAALCVALELGVQPLLFRAADGQALYFPFALNVTVPAMLVPHLLVASVVEGLVTVAAVGFVRRSAPELVAGGTPASASESVSVSASTASHRGGLRWSAWVALGVAALLSPIGLLATGDAWGEWGAEDFMGATGLDYVPRYIADGFTWNALLPDYSLTGLPDAAGYVLSAVIGVAILTIAFRLLAAALPRRSRGAGAR